MMHNNGNDSFNRYPYYKASKITWVASKKIGTVLSDRTVRCSNSSQGKLIISTNNNERSNCQILVRFKKFDAFKLLMYNIISINTSIDINGKYRYFNDSY